LRQPDARREGDVVAEQSRHGDLEIRHDPSFEGRTVAVQLVGWAVMALVVLAALLGLFGNGPLSSATVEGGALRVEYDRFLRHQAPQQLRLRLEVEGGQVRVWLNAEYLEHIQIEHIEPRPERVEVGPDGQTFTFLVEESATVVLHFVPERVGRLTARIRLAGKEALTFHQFVYP
jgi:hypothetical protein